ncbi:MAG: hypothetical protein GX597_13730 [Anaerolineaceae bacterium]|nr:hypothetical protein [Anaerolineaceae bacterium]
MAASGGHWTKSAGGKPATPEQVKGPSKATVYTKWVPDGQGGEMAQYWGVYANGKEVLLDTGKKQLAFAKRVGWDKQHGR